MDFRPTSQQSNRGGAQAGSAVKALEYRISQLEHLTTAQTRELRIQFERIAQLQAECDILRIRRTKP